MKWGHHRTAPPAGCFTLAQAGDMVRPGRPKVVRPFTVAVLVGHGWHVPVERRDDRALLATVVDAAVRFHG